MRRILQLAGLVAIGLLATALPAGACSCFQGDPRDQFEAADAAFIGEFVGMRPGPDPEWDAIYTFDVEEEWKTDFGETVDVHAANNGAACGIEAQPGQMVGLFLTMEGSDWSSSLCSQTSPSTMRQAASPLPEPNGKGDARMIVGGSFGKARVMALDKAGRTLGYGYGGDHDVAYLDACPGGRRFVEIYEMRTDQDVERRFVVRRVSDLEVVRDTDLGLDQTQYVSGVDCRDANADRSLLFVTPNYGKPNGAIYEESENGIKRLFKDLDARMATFGEKHVYMSGAKHRVWSMRLDGGSARVLYSVRDKQQLSEPILSPNGKHLAVVVYGSYEPERKAKLVLIRLDDGKVRTERLANGDGYGVVLTWDGSRKLVAVGPQGSPVFNLRLQKVGGIGRAYVSDAVVVGERLWGLYFGELLRADLPKGNFERAQVLPSPVTYSIISLPR